MHNHWLAKIGSDFMLGIWNCIFVCILQLLLNGRSSKGQRFSTKTSFNLIIIQFSLSNLLTSNAFNRRQTGTQQFIKFRLSIHTENLLWNSISVKVYFCTHPHSENKFAHAHTHTDNTFAKRCGWLSGKITMFNFIRFIMHPKSKSRKCCSQKLVFWD